MAKSYFPKNIQKKLVYNQLILQEFEPYKGNTTECLLQGRLERRKNFPMLGKAFLNILSEGKRIQVGYLWRKGRERANRKLD